jgi:hypothetical protein
MKGPRSPKTAPRKRSKAKDIKKLKSELWELCRAITRLRSVKADILYYQQLVETCTQILKELTIDS